MQAYAYIETNAIDSVQLLKCITLIKTDNINAEMLNG